MELSKLDKAKDRFVKIFQANHRVSELEAEQMYEVEAFTFKKQIIDNPALSECTESSILMTFLAVVSNGLTFNNSQKLVYLMTRSVRNAAGGYDKHLVYNVTPDGKIFQCQKAGSVKDVSKPVIVYEGDHIEITYNHVDYSPKIPRGDKIIGGFCVISYNDGRNEVVWVDIKDMEINKKASAKQNGKYDKTTKKTVPGEPNELYTSNDGQINPGFFSSKIINAALKNKAKKATYSEMEVQEEEVTQNYYVDADAVVRTVAPQDIAAGTNHDQPQDNQQEPQEYAF